MGLGRFYKNMLRGQYEFGRRMSGMITDNMSPHQAQAVGTLIDVGAGAALAYFSIPPMIAGLSAASAAVVAAAALPAAIPAAIGAVATAALVVGMGSLTVPLVAGLFSSAADRLHIPKPAAVAAGVKHAAHQTTQVVTKPFKWAGHKLSHAFRKAHDGEIQVPETAPKRKPKIGGNFDL